MSKICNRCGSTMGMGAPHSEEIKIQYECWCGNIETENYSAEELERNRRIEAENAGNQFNCCTGTPAGGHSHYCGEMF